MIDIRHVSDPLAAAIATYLDELLKHAPVQSADDVRHAVESAQAQLQEAARLAGVVPRAASK